MDISNIEANNDSVQIVIKAGDTCIGAIHWLEPKVEGDKIRLKCNYVRFDQERIAEAFAKGFLHVKSQRQPIQIEVFTNGKLSERFENAWLDKMSYSYSSSNWILTDCIEMLAEKLLQPENEEIVITYYDGTEIGSMDCIEIDREDDPMYSKCRAKITCGTITMKAETGGAPEFARGWNYHIEVRRNGKTETWLETVWFPENIEHEVLADGMIRIPAGALMRGKAIWRAGRR